MSRFKQRKDGEVFEVPLEEKHQIECCDCGLVHDFVFVLHKKKLYMAAQRNRRSTGQRRRWKTKVSQK